MRFHCPKCDTKYRITEDKLAERPTAKMRCKECAVVFSVQEAIAAEGQRASEASTPGEVDGYAVSPSSNPPPLGGVAPSPRPSAPPTSVTPANPLPSFGSLSRTPVATRPIGSPSDRPPSLTSALGARANPVSPTRPLGTPGASLLSPRTPLSPASKLSPQSSLGPLPSSTSVTPTAASSSLGAGSGSSAGARKPFGDLGAASAGSTRPLGNLGALPTPSVLGPKAPGVATAQRPIGAPKLGATGFGAAPAAAPGLTAPPGAGPVPAPNVARVAAEVRPPRGETLSLEPRGESTAAQAFRPTMPVSTNVRPAAPILGRGSAAGFPPVTAERTLPAVPPFHGASPESGDAPGSAGSIEPPAPDSLHDSATRPENDIPRPSENLSETPLVSSRANSDSYGVAAPTPRLAELNELAPVSPGSGAWSSNVNAPSEPPPGVPDTREVPVTVTGLEGRVSPTELSAPALVAEVTFAPPGRVLDDELDFGTKRKPSSKRVVSLGVAFAVAALFGASGFASGYLLGAASPGPHRADMPSAPATAVEVAGETRRDSLPPPPPPPVESVAAASVDEKLSAAVTPKPDEGKSKKPSDRRSEEAQESALAQPTPAVAGEGVSRPDPLSGLSMGVGPGPVAGPGASQAAAGTGLEASAIQSTVQKNQNAVKRSCWQPALNNRSADAPSTARVTTTIQISPTGAVTQVKHSGDPRGYPGLGACIVTRLKTWTFPKSNGSTTANIPFVFAAQ